MTPARPAARRGRPQLSAVRPTAARLRVRLRARASASRGDEGFILLESIVAISLITVLMGALASFTLNSLTATTDLRARQGAVQVATSVMGALGAVPSTDLLTGRTAAAVGAQYDLASSDVRTTWLSARTNMAFTSISSTTVTVPTTPTTQTLNGVAYSAETYLERCTLTSGSSTSTGTPLTCPAAAGGTDSKQLRAVVAVTWKGRGCNARPSVCTYVTATLISAETDPVFNTNRANPPIRPKAVNPGAKVSTVGAPQSVQLTVEGGTGTRENTWAPTGGALPAGLTLSSSGLISGTASTISAAASFTATVSDAYSRTDSVTFTWAVVAAPTVTSPGNQSTVRGQSVSRTITRDCPNAPCTYTQSGLPAGLSIDATNGTITGTPTTVGTSSVTVTATDANGVPGTSPAFTWQVLTPATIAAPGALAATVGTTASVAVTYTCAVTPCTVTLAGAMPGVGLSATTPNTAAGGNNATSLNVSAASGTVYLTGIVQTSAVPSGSTSKAYAPALAITDNGSPAAPPGAAGAWTAYARPTTSAVGTQTVYVTGKPNIPVTYACPNAPCTLTLSGSVPGLGLSATSGRTTANTATTLTVNATSGTVYVNGLVGSTAVPSGSTTKPYTVGLVISDASAATATSSGTWTASVLPKITNPGTVAVKTGANITLPLDYACARTACSFYADAAPAGSTSYTQVAVSSSGVLTFNNAPEGSYTARVTLTDSTGAKDTVTFTLIVRNFSLSIPDQSTTRPASGSTTATLDVRALMQPQADGYTYQLANGAPSWLTIDPSTGLITATVTNATTSATGIRVTVTSTASNTSTVTSNAFTWSTP